MIAFLQGFAVCFGIAIAAGILLGLCVVACAWWEDYQERRYQPSPLEAAWEEHVATTPGVLDISPEAMREFEEDMAGGAS
jgi:hypothetical protein